ncbi:MULTISPECIES: endonuclease/exonuclease/phosphatase family protein [unclassified Caulobacter]|jgi:endonuclease/exonuclease/phosphatase (EEP) superfamily protein YafD|uniref:endonuclease/exonuclease/phosphatase family protein n=1 Tax=unclassified Caulobacter TaxID=2648921 RepID=UPI0006F52531|nr:MULTISPECIES: endonuclease/exonuclease/phosphatase family protein [unclassified Caulobacter]KQV57667.1 endonuclease [Caulobacter sp. Root342]KQV67240.1 endonuclease [Caulobacter sp. Root343]
MRLIVQLLSLLVRGTALMLGLVGAGMAIACLGGAFSDRLDAFTHAAPLWLMMGFGAVILGALFARGGERWVMVGLGATTLAACAVLMLPDLWAAWRFKPATVAASDLKVVQFNIWHENRTPEQSLEWILAQDADVVVMEEAGGNAIPVVRALKEAYPFASCDKAGRCETWIFSRKKMLARGGVPMEMPYLSGAWATLADAKGAFTVAGVHYTWPIPAGPQQAQSRKLVQALAPFDRKSLILTGDFNSTPWSFTLKRQDKALGLRRWTRALASWPAGKFSRVMAAPAPFLPIDHVYAGSEWRAVKIERGPALGSDHRPVVVTLRRTQK